MFNRRNFIANTALAGGGLVLASRTNAEAADALKLSFMLHATFFSSEMKLAKPLDPQAFVYDPAVPAGVGPQGIHHLAGYRPCLIAGPVDVEAYNANGKPLGFQIADWFAARGEVKIVRYGAGALVTSHFTNLIPNGLYSLFENHFDMKPIGFTPLDGTGTSNSFNADANGSASITVKAAKKLSHANAVLLVYHSDHQSHGLQRGDIGITAHHQLIARIPV
ncbi:MAG: hypothetical protein B7Z75_13775 [Acidocella sp. 20-57-95]|nr:MAG: hypothetical protein B7Z75_13775 [Acidocella sp. 20-57-95]